MFTKDDGELILGIYVDDGILIGSNIQQMNHIIEELRKEFKMTVNKNPRFFVGFEIKKGKKSNQTDARGVFKNYFEQ